jgi:flavodoxin
MKQIKTVVLVCALLATAGIALNAEQKQEGTMKSVVIYYSYSGNTAAVAGVLADEIGADLVKTEDVIKPGKFKAYVLGAVAARKEKAWPVKPLNIDLSGYNRVFIGAPVWWGKQAPEINGVIDQLDLKGKKVVVFVTLGGHNSDEALKALAEKAMAKGGTVVSSFAITTGGKSRENIEARTGELAQQYKNNQQ